MPINVDTRCVGFAIVHEHGLLVPCGLRPSAQVQVARQGANGAVLATPGFVTTRASGLWPAPGYNHARACGDR